VSTCAASKSLSRFGATRTSSELAGTKRNTGCSRSSAGLGASSSPVSPRKGRELGPHAQERASATRHNQVPARRWYCEALLIGCIESLPMKRSAETSVDDVADRHRRAHRAIGSDELHPAFGVALESEERRWPLHGPAIGTIEG